MPSRIIFCVLSVMKLESALPEISKPRPIHINNCADEANVPKRNAEFNTACDGLTIFNVAIASDTEDSPTTDPSTITRAPATVECALRGREAFTGGLRSVPPRVQQGRSF